jgi:hypothetical protein
MFLSGRRRKVCAKAQRKVQSYFAVPQSFAAGFCKTAKSAFAPLQEKYDGKKRKKMGFASV